LLNKIEQKYTLSLLVATDFFSIFKQTAQCWNEN